MNLAAESTAFMFGLYIAKENKPFCVGGKREWLTFPEKSQYVQFLSESSRSLKNL